MSGLLSDEELELHRRMHGGCLRHDPSSCVVARLLNHTDALTEKYAAAEALADAYVEATDRINGAPSETHYIGALHAADAAYREVTR